MPTEIRIYYEGDERLRPGFHAFLKEIIDLARSKRCRLSLIAAEGAPASDFDIALRMHPHSWNILLMDSEGPDSGNLSAALIAQQGWTDAHQDSIFWMVQMMESWFHADKDALQKFYGPHFNRGAMNAGLQVETIGKEDLLDGLKAATKNTKKGAYHKTKHAPQLLQAIQPSQVRALAPNCERLFQVVLARLA